MPHRCAGCKTLFPDARHLKDGCPVCGCGKFVFETGNDRKEPSQSTVQENPASPPSKSLQEKSAEILEKKRKKNQNAETIESIRILEPGRYDLNLSRLAESDDRVVRVGLEETYRLDLHSMIGKKKKK